MESYKAMCILLDWISPIDCLIEEHMFLPLVLVHSRLREKSSQTKHQKNYPSKSKASFQYLHMRKVHEKILRVCFLKALGDFGPQSLLISPNSQFFIKQHREVNNSTLPHSFILWVLILHKNFRHWLDRVIFGHFGLKLGQDWPKIGPK